MADAAVAAPAPAEGAQADTPFWQKLFRTIFVWWLISTAVKHFTGSGSDAPATSGGGGTHSNLWRPDERFDLAVFASDNPVYDPVNVNIYYANIYNSFEYIDRSRIESVSFAERTLLLHALSFLLYFSSLFLFNFFLSSEFPSIE